MTITMTEKHQITIPKRIAETLGLTKGSLFEVGVRRNRIELVPVEVKEKEFSEEEYAKLDKLVREEKEKAVRVTKAYIRRLKQGKP